MCSRGFVYLGKHLRLLFIFGVCGVVSRETDKQKRRIHREQQRESETIRKRRKCTYCRAVAELVWCFRTVVALSDVRIVYDLFVY